LAGGVLVFARGRFRYLTFFAALLILITACGGGESSGSAEPPAALAPGRTLVLGDNQFESLWINNGILEHGYGHPTSIRVAASADLQDVLADGSVDVWAEMWHQNW